MRALGHVHGVLVGEEVGGRRGQELATKGRVEMVVSHGLGSAVWRLVVEFSGYLMVFGLGVFASPQPQLPLTASSYRCWCRSRSRSPLAWAHAHTSPQPAPSRAFVSPVALLSLPGIEGYTHRMNILYWSGSFSCGMRGGDQQISGILRIVQRFVRLKIGGGSPQDVVVAAGLADARNARRIRHAVV